MNSERCHAQVLQSYAVYAVTCPHAGVCSVCNMNNGLENALNHRTRRKHIAISVAPRLCEAAKYSTVSRTQLCVDLFAS